MAFASIQTLQLLLYHRKQTQQNQKKWFAGMSKDSITSLSFRFSTHMKNVDPWNDLASVSGNNITVVIFWDTVNINKCHTLHDGSNHWPSTHSNHLRCQVTAVSNSFNWKLNVLFRLSWNFLRLLITSNKLWIY